MYVKVRQVVGCRKWGSICVLRRQTLSPAGYLCLPWRGRPECTTEFKAWGC